MKWLRECLRLQVADNGMPIKLTTFGRAKIMTGEHPIYSELPDCYMAYWLRLPVFEHRYRSYMDDHAMQQMVWLFHGKDGFRIIWADPR